MAAPITKSFYLSRKEDPDHATNMKKIKEMTLFKPTQEKTIFVFGENPALGVFVKSANTDLNGRAVKREQYKPEAAPLPKPAPVPRKAAPSVIAAPPRALTPPPKEPAQLTSPEKANLAAGVLLNTTSTRLCPPNIIFNRPPQGLKIIEQIRNEAKKRKAEETAPAAKEPAGPPSPEKVKAASILTEITNTVRQEQQKKSDAMLMPPPPSKQPRTHRSSSVQHHS